MSAGKMQELRGENRGSRRTIKIIVFDVGGVVFKNPDPLIKANLHKRLELTESVIEALWKTDIVLLQTGIIDEREFWRKIQARLQHKLPSGYKTLLTPPFHYLSGKIIPFIKKLKQKYAVAFFTNTIPPHYKEQKKLITRDIGEVPIIASCKIGHVKPEKEAYTALLDCLHYSPQEILYIDDTPEHVRAAARFNIRAIQFTDVKSLRLFFGQE